MATPTRVFISFMVLLSLVICSAQPLEVDHHNHKAHTLSNIDVQGVGGGSGGGFDIGGGGFGIGGGRFGIGGGGGGFGIGIGIGGGGRFGFDIGGVVPSYGSPIYIPGFVFPVHSPGCGYVCPANNPSGEITELKISGLSYFTRPYRCSPGPNMHGDKDFNHELLLHFVSTMQDKHENKQQRLPYGGNGGDAGPRVGGGRRLGFGRGSGREVGGLDGCGYVCPGNSPSGGITEFHISGLSHFNGPYRCRPDMCGTEKCDELLLHFVSPIQDKHENQHGHQSEQQEDQIINEIPTPPHPHPTPKSKKKKLHL